MEILKRISATGILRNSSSSSFPFMETQRQQSIEKVFNKIGSAINGLNTTNHRCDFLREAFGVFQEIECTKV
jgi:hypothetical protein